MRRRSVVIGIAAVAALFLVLLVAWLGSQRERSGRDHGVAAADLPDTTGSREDERGARTAALAVVEVPTRLAAHGAQFEAHSEPVRGADARPARWRGRVLDLEGRAVVDVAVARASQPQSPFTRTGADGSFDLPERDIQLTVVDPRWYTLRDTEPLPGADGSEILVVVAPLLAIGGHVVESDGRAVAGASVRLEIPWSTFAAFPVPLDRGRLARSSATTTDEFGRFELAIPRAPRMQIVAQKESLGAAAIPAPTEARADLVIAIHDSDDEDDLRVEGEVVHADGVPAPDALVCFGEARAQAGEDGRFVLRVPGGVWEPMPLVAALRGFQAAVVPDFTALLASSASAPHFQRLVLGPEPLTIEGRVVDHEGRPLAGFVVQPVDPVVLRAGLIPPDSAEAIGHGAPIRAESGADGSFVLEGLQERAYRLQAHGRSPFVRIETEPIAAGARNVRLVVPANASFDSVEGRVVAHDGTPIPGIEVHCTLIVFATGFGYTSESSSAVTTDQEGRFALRGVPRQRSHLTLTGAAILPKNHDLADHVEGDVLRITAARRCHVRVEGVPESSRLHSLSVYTESGEKLQLMQFQAGGWMSSSELQLTGGASPLFAVAETARTMVFRGSDGEEVARALTLEPGVITTVRW
ncbi:MAG: carboxypeptidase regulatory-like domain-containing protein [Planctomycetes bacterium]|nr:carboxypeptidase regulatory-like domain-containing protein [Planctomycetota bacterium]